jgi:outer membrane protein, heavy metal efflux system
MRSATGARNLLGLILILGLGACASFTPRPLPADADLAPDAGRLNVDVSKIRLAPLGPHPIDPAKGLDPTDVAILAVLNSPELKAKRAAAKVAAAQAFSASLLPDPQLTFTLDVPNPGQGALTAYNVNPNLDLVALITHATALKAARASAGQADLDLLWAEWSAAQQARQLAVSIMGNESKAQVLQAVAAELGDRYSQSKLAFERRDLPASATGADLAAKLDAEAQLATARRDSSKARGELNVLLGLAPTVSLNLIPGKAARPAAPATLDSAVSALPERRPDLLALKAGYRAQNANLRRAILMQFPVLNLGFSHQQDNTGITSNGISATFVIPIFNRGRGEIAVQTATRERLSAEYQARLDQTVADVAAARRDRGAAAGALAKLEAQVPTLEAMAAQARAAERRGDIDSGAFLALDQAALKQRVALLDQRLAVDLADISVDTVLFIPSGQDTAP